MAYDKPKIDLVNKKYETLSKGLNKIYGDVAKNADLIKKRNKARLKGQLDGIAKMQKRFEDATTANVIAAANLKDQIGGDSDSETEAARNLFVGQVNDLYLGGLDDIELFMQGKIDENGNAVTGGKAPTRGATSAFVNKLIGNAINVTDGLIGLDSFSDEYNEGLKNLAGSNGKNKGSLVLGSQYDGIFNTVNGETAMTQGESLSYKDLMLHGRLSSKDGVKVFLDKDQSGGMFEQADLNVGGQIVKVNTNEINTGEILDLSQVGKDYKKADNKYFTKVKGWDDYFKAPIKAIQATKASGQFLVPFKYTDANGNVVDGKRIDVKKRQQYFTSGEGKKVVDNIIQTTTAEDMNGMIQAIGGMKLYQKYTTGTQEEKAKIMEIVKLGIIENMSPLVTKGETSKLVPSTSTVSQTYKGSNFENDAVYDIVKNDVADVTNAVFSGHRGGFPPATELNSAFKGHYFKMATSSQSGKIGYGKIDSFVEDPSQPGLFKLKILVKPPTSRSGAVYEEIPFDLNSNPAGGNARINNRAALERGLAFGYFPDEDSAHLQDMVKQANEGNPKFLPGTGDSKVSTKKQVADMTVEEFNAYVNGDTVPKVDDIVNEFLDQNPVVGGGPQSGVGPQSSGGPNVSNAGPQGTSQGISFNASNTSLQGSMSFGQKIGLYDNPVIKVDSDPSSTGAQIAKVLNWENENGFSKYGFTGAMREQENEVQGRIKSKHPNLKGPELAAMVAAETASKYIVGEDGADLGNYKKSTILQDLSIDRTTFDNLDPDLKHFLVDYKVNATERSAKDFIMILTGDWDGQKAGANVSDLSDEDKKIYGNFDATSNPTGFKFDVAKLQNIGPRDLERARLSLYTDGGTNLTRQTVAGKRPDQAGTTGKGRMSGFEYKTQISKTPLNFDTYEDFKDQVLKVEIADPKDNTKTIKKYKTIEEYYLSNGLLPGDKLTLKNGDVYEIPKF